MAEMKRRRRGEGRKDLRAAAGMLGVLVVLALVCLLSFPALTAQGAENAFAKPGPNDKCPVCGMLVEPYRNWWASVVFADGTRAFFDGPKDLFKYISNLKKFNPSKQESDIAAVYVTDYYGTTQIDAKKAWYVTGSDVNGPMGPEPVPFGRESDAKTFLKDHKGKKVLTFEAAALEVSSGGHHHTDHGQHE